MSQPATERPPSSRPESARSQGGFDRKIAGLPTWGWVLIAAGAGIAYILYRRYTAAQAAAAQSNQTYTPSGIDYGPQLATIQSEIQDLQGTLSKKKDTDKDEDAEKDKDGNDHDEDNEKKKPPAKRPPPRKRKPAPRKAGGDA